MRSRSVVPPMPSEVSSASAVPGRRSPCISASLATILGSLMRMRCRMLRSQQNHEFIARAADVARADGKDGVPGTRLFEQILDAFLHRMKIVNVFMTSLANSARKRFARHARDGRFTGGIDVGGPKNGGLIGGAAEIRPGGHGGGRSGRFETPRRSM